MLFYQFILLIEYYSSTTSLKGFFHSVHFYFIFVKRRTGLRFVFQIRSGSGSGFGFEFGFGFSHEGNKRSSTTVS